MYEHEREEKQNALARTMLSGRSWEAWSHKFWGASVALWLVDWTVFSPVTKCSLAAIICLGGWLACTQMAVKSFHRADGLLHELPPKTGDEE